jgi:hypothetical protein
VIGADWRAFYDGELQGLWALLPVPALWLAVRALRGRPRGSGADPQAAGFVDAWALVFALETLLDPIATGPLARALGGAWPTALGVLFVLLGDFRVLLLVCFLAGGRNALGPALREAALLTPVVALFAMGTTRAAGLLLGQALPGQLLWLVHETAFLGMVAFLRRRVVAAREPVRPSPRAAYLRAATAYVAGYYGLWAACDALILAGVDWAWGLRALPNQLYYAWFVPFAHARFFAASKASTSRSTQASR